MATNYDAPIELRELEKMITSFSYHGGHEISRVFDDWLQFIIYNFTIDMKPDTDYTFGENEELKGRELKVSDPTCGSGRTLICFHSHAPGNFMYGEDIDKTCAMMTVCNFLIHGTVGEVVWHDSLNPNSYFGGWMVNEDLNNIFSKYNGIPHVREMKKEESFIWRHWENVKKEFESSGNNRIEKVKVIKSVMKNDQLQLELF